MSLLDFLYRVYVPLHPGLSSNSLWQMVIAVRVLQAWAGRTLRPDELSNKLLRAFLLDYLQRPGISRATVNGKRRLLLALWRCAKAERFCGTGPGRIQRVTEELAEPEAWTAEEVGSILSAAHQETGSIASIPAGPWFFSLLLTAYETGARIGALLKAAPDHLSLAHAGLLLVAEKNHRQRWCSLSAEALEAIRAIRAIQEPRRPYIWPWPYCPEWLRKRMRRLLARAGVIHGQGRGGLFHKIRRTSGTLVEAAGGDGARHIGVSRAIFERHYLDPRICRPSQLALLPRPVSLSAAQSRSDWSI